MEKPFLITNIKTMKDISIPYILNGELYKILTQDGDNVTVRCCSCPSDRIYRGSVRSTGNFHMHIKRRHPELLGRLHEMKVGSLIERRERLLTAKKMAIKGRIKKEISQSETIDSVHEPTETDEQCPIDYSLQNRPVSPDAPQHMQIQTLNPSIQNVFIATEVHCDGNSNMGVRLPSLHLSPIKQEMSPVDENQAIDLSTSSSRRVENTLSLQVSNLRWEQVLERVEDSLKSIQHELRTRNQIETNRIYLDLAKFKYLHPGFHYQS